MHNKNNSTFKRKYVSTKRAVQHQLRSLKETWWQNKAAELQRASDAHDTKAFYRGLKAVYAPSSAASSPLLSSDGKELLASDKERWVEHTVKF